MAEREPLSEHPAGEAHGRSLENGRALKRLIKNWKTKKTDREPDSFEPDEEEDFSRRRKNAQQTKTSRKQGKTTFTEKKDFPWAGHRKTENLLP